MECRDGNGRGERHRRVPSIGPRTSPVGARADCLGCFQAKPTSEDPKLLEHCTFGIVEQVIAPGDSGPHRLLPGRQILRPANQER